MNITPHYVLVNGDNVGTHSNFEDAVDAANGIVDEHTASVIVVADGKVVWEYEQ